jgi:flagellar biosynthesis component FlhA
MLAKEGEFVRRLQPWQYLIGIFVVFWIIFAIVLFLGDIPFFVISIALTTIAALSFLVVLLAWAYQNNL